MWVYGGRRVARKAMLLFCTVYYIVYRNSTETCTVKAGICRFCTYPIWKLYSNDTKPSGDIVCVCFSKLSSVILSCNHERSYLLQRRVIPQRQNEQGTSSTVSQESHGSTVAYIHWTICISRTGTRGCRSRLQSDRQSLEALVAHGSTANFREKLVYHTNTFYNSSRKHCQLHKSNMCKSFET